MGTEDTPIPGPLNNVIRIDDERIKGHLDRVVVSAPLSTGVLLAWISLDVESDQAATLCVAGVATGQGSRASMSSRVVACGSIVKICFR